MKIYKHKIKEEFYQTFPVPEDLTDWEEYEAESVEDIRPAAAKKIMADAQEKTWRDSALQATDKYLISDYPIAPEDLAKIKAYRTQLRDYPDTAGFAERKKPGKPKGLSIVLEDI